MHKHLWRQCWLSLAAALLLISTVKAQTACSVNYVVTSQTQHTFNAEITIYNTGTTPVSSWNLRWTFANGQTVSRSFNSSYTQQGPNVTLTNLASNGQIAAGSNLGGIGITATWNNHANTVPSSFMLNNVACSSGVPPAPSFTLRASPSTISMPLAGSGTSTITVAGAGGFSGNVTLGANGVPSGVTVTFSPDPTTGSSVATFTAGPTATPGTSYVSIMGVSGSLGASTNIALAVTGPATVTPSVTVTPEALTHNYAENLLVNVTVAGVANASANQYWAWGAATASTPPTGTVTLSGGNYTSPPIALSSGANATYVQSGNFATPGISTSSSSATFYIQPGMLGPGSDTLTATYYPDSTSAGFFGPATGTATMTITPPGSTNVTVEINTLANRHQISPYIYGTNSTSKPQIADLAPGVARFGGNVGTNYNWLTHSYNSGADWFYEDFPLGDPSGGSVDSVGLTQSTVKSGSQMITTMPLLDWVAKEPGSLTGGNYNWSFPVHTFGPQCVEDPWEPDAGNGFDPGTTGDCSTSTMPVTTSAQTGAYYPLVDTPSDCPSGTVDGSTCVDRQTYAQALATAFGNKLCSVPYSQISTCHFYDMDNEPEIWNGSHRDVHPDGVGYTELLNRFVKEGRALKSWDPSAVRFGPVSSGSFFLFMAGGPGDDKTTHAGIDFAPWWLNELKWQDQISGTRTIDVFDTHAYVGDNVSTAGFTFSQSRAAAGKIFRNYWDPTYYSSSYDADWITTTQPNRGVLFLIPRMKALINAIYPGTPLSFTEWDSWLVPQQEWDFSTALSDADGYGVMGREGLSFSTRWAGPSPTDTTTNQPHPNYTAFKLWTNYDGARHGFGSVSVSDTSSANPDLFVSYAALNAAGTQMTIMVLNKDAANNVNATFDLDGFTASSVTSYTVSSTNPGMIVPSPTTGWNTTQTFAANSITLLVVNGNQNQQLAAEWYLNPDDLMIPASGTGILHPQIVSGSGNVTLTSAVFDSFAGAPACSGSLTLTNPQITPTTPGTITVNPGSTPGFCHYTVTAKDGPTVTESGWIVVGQPAGTLAVTGGNGQFAGAGTTLTTPLTVTFTPPAGTTFTAGGAEVLFTTSAGTLSNGTTTGTSVIATTDSSGVASVTLTLPSSSGTVMVNAQSQFAVGGTTVSFTETAQ
jgi:hypothetical protein